MWTVLAILCLLASFDASAARSSQEELSSLEKSSPSVMELRRLEDTPIRHPRKLSGNSRTTRLHIKNQHGFDGKVEKIHINSEEDLPGIRAYGLQRKHRLNNGHIERKIKAESLEEDNDASRVTRSIEAYGKNKEHLATNGHIERVRPSLSSSRYQTSGSPQARSIRSIDTESKRNDAPDDLEAQDAKVFRPLFVYRQQVAKRQHRARNNVYGVQGSQKPCHDRRRPVY